MYQTSDGRNVCPEASAYLCSLTKISTNMGWRIREKGIVAGLILLMSTYSVTTNSQSINSNWKQELSTALKEFVDCENTAQQGINPCNKFIGSALKTVYNIDDFYSRELGRHLLVSEISKLLESSEEWTLLGRAYEQNALAEAQKLANAKQAVVAIYLSEENIGHLSLIVPGDLTPSGSWGFQVPNSASFFVYDPQNSYIGKGLSYSFGRNIIRHVLLYARNYD